jgi:hypothetical protein
MNLPFLTSNSIKELFDSIRNVGISAGVFYAGYTVKNIPAFKLESPNFAHFLGHTLVALSYFLLALCVLYCYGRLKDASGLHRTIVVALSFFFAATTCLIFLTLPMSHGVIY